MKKLLLYIAIFALLFLVLRSIIISPCDPPLRYRVDTVDSQFELSRDKFTELVNRAASIWNKAYGKPLFVYDPEGNLSVNLVYDERQRLNLQIYTTEGQLAQKQTSLDQQIAAYHKDVATFEAKLTALNQQIQEWNDKGGAPEDVYNQLRQEQADLKAEADRLEQTAKTLKISATSFNNQVSTLNKNINTFNATLEERPEEGIFIPRQNRIEIYFHITEAETLHTLAHEFGHAVRLDHNDNPKSIMFFKTNQSITPSPEDLDSLKESCAAYSLLERMRRNLEYWITTLIEPAVRI